MYICIISLYIYAIIYNYIYIHVSTKGLGENFVHGDAPQGCLLVDSSVANRRSTMFDGQTRHNMMFKYLFGVQ
jgi:hypothetical protein